MTGSPRELLTYVTDLERTLSGGGAYAVNWHAADELEKGFRLNYAGPIVPKVPIVASGISRIRRRIFGRPGTYTYFSSRTLDDNARRAANAVVPGSRAIVFRSAGRWCHSRPSLPYFVYLDAVTKTFFNNTFDEKDFLADDLKRIWNEEAEFLEKATAVFFESRWGMDQAIQDYSLVGTHYSVAGRGGVIHPPSSDTWDGESLALVTVAMNFRQKGGDVVAEAYRILKPKFPSLTWHIVGGKPDFDTTSIDGITWEGVLRPAEPEHAARLSTILANAFALVHPTREDTSPLVITEAAYFGCPSISVNVFAIPELVIDGETGILTESPATGASVANAIERLIVDRNMYLTMRRAARDYGLAHFNWDRVGTLMRDTISRAIGL